MRRLFLLGLALTLGCGDFGSHPGGTLDAVPDQVLYEPHIREITTRYCVECHIDPPRNGAPDYFRLDQYEDDANGKLGVLNMADAIRAVTVIDYMPKGRTPLSQIEKDTIARWIAQRERW